jgi:hypothetical protein
VGEQGWGADRMAAFLFEQGNALLQASASSLAFRAGVPAYAAAGLRVAASADDVRVLASGGPGVRMALLPTWTGGSRSVTAAVRPL